MGHRIVCRLRVLAPLFLLAALAVGCSSGRYPVAGRVIYPDGSPVEAGTVIAEATVDGKLVGVQGNIGKDGSFRMGADRPGDGALPGEYRVLIMPVALSDLELSQGKMPAVDGKFASYKTSGLSFEIKPQSNVLDITVSRPRSKPGRK